MIYFTTNQFGGNICNPGLLFLFSSFLVHSDGSQIFLVIFSLLPMLLTDLTCMWFTLLHWKPKEGLALSQKMSIPYCSCAFPGFIQSCWHWKVFFLAQFKCRACICCFFLVCWHFISLFSEDELLSTHFGSSTLSLLMSGFGIEDSSFLHEISAKDGVLRISGYISSPYDSFSVKV